MWVEGFEREESVQEVNRHGQIERDRENENQIALKPIYRSSVILDKQRCREVLSQGLRGIESSVETSVEKAERRQMKLSKGVKEEFIRYDQRSSIDPPTIKKLSKVQKLS